MTAEVLSLDGARVSAREVMPCFETLTLTAYDRPMMKMLDRLMRAVGRRADGTFGADMPRKSYVYVTYEEVVEMPEPAPAA